MEMAAAPPRKDLLVGHLIFVSTFAPVLPQHTLERRRPEEIFSNFGPVNLHRGASARGQRTLIRNPPSKPTGATP